MIWGYHYFWKHPFLGNMLETGERWKALGSRAFLAPLRESNCTAAVEPNALEMPNRLLRDDSFPNKKSFSNKKNTRHLSTKNLQPTIPAPLFLLPSYLCGFPKWIYCRAWLLSWIGKQDQASAWMNENHLTSTGQTVSEFETPGFNGTISIHFLLKMLMMSVGKVLDKRFLHSKMGCVQTRATDSSQTPRIQHTPNEHTPNEHPSMTPLWLGVKVFVGCVPVRCAGTTSEKKYTRVVQSAIRVRKSLLQLKEPNQTSNHLGEFFQNLQRRFTHRTIFKGWCLILKWIYSEHFKKPDLRFVTLPETNSKSP